MVDDAPSTPGQGLSQCTRRAYGYDADSNRLSMTSWTPDPVTGACNSNGAGAISSWTYDVADRVTNAGYQFDAFGRVTQVPASDAGAQQVSLTNHANDRVRSLTANGITNTVTIDPVKRVRQTSSGSVTQTWHYALDADSPTWIAESSGGLLWTRNVLGPGGTLAAIVDQASSVVLQITNLHGDVVATASGDPAATALASVADQTEFGVPRQASSSRYSWLGGYQRATEPTSGMILMGARVYAPGVGRFLQVDPVPCGSANAYDYAFQDPMTSYDLSGLFGYRCFARCIYNRFQVFGQSGVVRAALGPCMFFCGSCLSMWGFPFCVPCAICAIGAAAIVGYVVWPCYRACKYA
jgi:RHS repeat-associated protein